MSSDVRSLPFSECPLPATHVEEIRLGHGSGGKLTAQLIERMFLPAFRNPALEALDDQAIVAVNGSRLAFTTDSYVITPIFFPGGDIGELAVNGTINDLARGRSASRLPSFSRKAFPSPISSASSTPRRGRQSGPASRS